MVQIIEELSLSSTEVAEIVLDTTNHTVMIENIVQGVDKISTFIYSTVNMYNNINLCSYNHFESVCVLTNSPSR